MSYHNRHIITTMAGIAETTLSESEGTVITNNTIRKLTDSHSMLMNTLCSSTFPVKCNTFTRRGFNLLSY